MSLKWAKTTIPGMTVTGMTISPPSSAALSTAGLDVVDLDVEHGLGSAIHAGAHTSADALALLFHAHQPVREIGGRLGDVPIEQVAVILL